MLCAVPEPLYPVEPESDAVCVCAPCESVEAGSVEPPLVKYLYVLPEPEPVLYCPDAA